MMDDTLRNSTYNQKNGRYIRGGRTETSGERLEWWDKREVLPDPSDIIYIMEAKYEGRPDLLGYAFYGDTGLWWVICQYNGILDPLSELIEGKPLLIPTKTKVDTFFKADTTALGGVSTKGR
jgi:hypothetical protein